LNRGDRGATVPFTAISGVPGFDVRHSFPRSRATARFAFRVLSGAAVADDSALIAATGERVVVQAEATLLHLDVGAVVPLCSVMWAAAAAPAVNASAFNAAFSRAHCVVVPVQPCLVGGRRSI
jgi:hypothetical protein